MALIIQDLYVIANLVRIGIKPSHVLSLGHPDILATPDEVAPIFDGKLLSTDNERVRQERIGPSRNECIGSAYSFFDELRAKLTCFDKRSSFGIHENPDLNYPVGDQHNDFYSLVVDPGTIEHVMNVGEVLKSIVRMLRVGGYVYHVSPMSMFNHGYWNFSPVAYYDFYTANGFENVRLEGRRKNGGSFDVPTTSRFKENSNLMITCVARKIKQLDNIVWPVQAKYT